MQTVCGAVCADLRSDDQHCGACGVACPADQACAGGACYPRACGTVTCPAADVCIGNLCVQRDCFGVVCPMDQRCAGGACQPANCSGQVCAADQVCVADACVAADCVGVICPTGAVCLQGACTQNTCGDGLKNGTESDTDCGGICAPCADGKACATLADCRSRVCTGGSCQVPSCMDGVRNGAESDVDCGGTCSGCADGSRCGAAADCTSGVCTMSACAAPSCTDHVKNAQETDVDCGGASCPKCGTGSACAIAADCMSGACMGGRCVSMQCTDGMQNGSETDVDCGGPQCAPCGNAKTCGVAGDCVSGVCTSMKCAVPSCSDMVKNGTETGVDCGGGCPGCPTAGACNVPADCASLKCGGNKQCLAPTCTDQIRNGGESDVDCGGSSTCPRCGGTGACDAGTDCLSSTCTANHCTTPPLFSLPTQHPVQMQPSDIAVGDLDGDGNVDIAVSNAGSSSISLMYGDGTGGFTPAYNVGVPNVGWDGPWSIGIVDFTGDGVADVLTMQSNPNGCRLDILAGTGTRGLFGAPIFDQVQDAGMYSGCGTTMAIARVDGDMLPDVVISDHAIFGNQMGDVKGGFFVRNTGGPPYAPLVLLPGISSYLALYDFNHDGKLDVVSHSDRNAEVRVAYGDGNGGFNPLYTQAISSGAGAVAVGEYNGDNNADIVVTMPSTGTFGILFGSDAGTWSSPYTISGLPGPMALTTVDFDGDGQDDVVSGPRCCSSLGVSFFRGLGNGQLATPVAIPFGNALFQAGRLLGVDVNKDGKPDLIALEDNYTLAVFVFLNQRP
jgi:hypothetical protein